MLTRSGPARAPSSFSLPNEHCTNWGAANQRLLQRRPWNNLNAIHEDHPALQVSLGLFMAM